MGTAGCEADTGTEIVVRGAGRDGEMLPVSNSAERHCSRLSLSKKDEPFMVRKSAEEFCGSSESRRWKGSWVAEKRSFIPFLAGCVSRESVAYIDLGGLKVGG